ALVELVVQLGQRRGAGELVLLAFLGSLIGGHQRPSHFGSRFSKKAAAPARRSSVVKVRDSCERRYSRPSSTAMSPWRYIASWPSFISSGDFEARRVAQSATAASNSSAAT